MFLRLDAPGGAAPGACSRPPAGRELKAKTWTARWNPDVSLSQSSGEGDVSSEHRMAVRSRARQHPRQPLRRTGTRRGHPSSAALRAPTASACPPRCGTAQPDLDGLGPSVRTAGAWAASRRQAAFTAVCQN